MAKSSKLFPLDAKLNRPRSGEPTCLEIGNDLNPRALEISFHRTIRVPDNQETSELPPTRGKFPLYSVAAHRANLPTAIRNSGGIFFPMYQREAMWIKFKSKENFAIKIYLGGVNAISGEPYHEGMATAFRRAQTSQDSEKTLQDYVVTPNQLWLDGIAPEPGKVRQFTAVPLNSGYSVEAQLLGSDFMGGIQIEVTATKKFSLEQLKSSMQVNITKAGGGNFTVPCDVDDTVLQLKVEIAERDGTPAEQQNLIFGGKKLADNFTLQDYRIKNGSTVHFSLKLSGGAMKAVRDTRMVFAAGGLIRQSIQKDTIPPNAWAPDTSLAMSIHVLDSAQFLAITGLDPPPTPISIESYTAMGLPFFHLEEPASDVHGSAFKNVASVKQTDQVITTAKGFEPETDDPVVKPRVIPIKALRYTVIPSPNGTLQAFRTLSDLEDLTRSMRVASFDSDETMSDG